MLLRELEMRGLVLRKRHRSDGRAKSLHVFATGTALIEKAEAQATAAEAYLTRSLTAAERQLMLQLLRETCDHLRPLNCGEPARTGLRS